MQQLKNAKNFAIQIGRLIKFLWNGTISVSADGKIRATDHVC